MPLIRPLLLLRPELQADSRTVSARDYIRGHPRPVCSRSN